jgi:hypothetical protein
MVRISSRQTASMNLRESFFIGAAGLLSEACSSSIADKVFALEWLL